MKPIILRTEAEINIAEPHLAALRRIAEVVTTTRTDRAGLIEAAREATLILTREADICGPLIEAAANLKGIVEYGPGVDNIDLDTATGHGVMVADCPGLGPDTAADHAFALLIALARRLPEIAAAMNAAGPTADLPGLELAGKTMGLIGYGGTGSAMAGRCLGFGMKLLCHDPYVDDPGEPGVRFAELDELLGRSDFVSIHAPLTDQTSGLIGARELNRMKPQALLINISGAAIVDRAALLRALEKGGIGGAGIDVSASEMPSPDDPLRAMANVILTPHMAWRTKEALERVGRQAQENILDILGGEIPRGLKNPAVINVLGRKRSQPDGPDRSSAFEPQRADRIPRGQAVIRPGDETTLYLKAERQGAEYINHYLVPIDPVPGHGLALIYVDPGEPLIDCSARPAFDLSPPGGAAAPAVGDIFGNPKGTFLKVIETPKSQKMFAFIDIETGEVKRRQERRVSGVHARWRLQSLLGPEGASRTPDELRRMLKG